MGLAESGFAGQSGFQPGPGRAPGTAAGGRPLAVVFRPGLPALEKGLRLRTRAEVQLGDVRPFVFEQATAHHFLEGGASIILQFSKPVAPSLTNEWNRWIQLEPLASNISVGAYGRNLSLRGDFQSGTCYRLAARAGMPAEEMFTLDKAAATNIIMPAIPARLYFPAFSQDQQAVGRRQFPLLAVNVPNLRLRAKMLEPDAAIYALCGYDSYFRSWPDYGVSGELYRRLEFALIPGRTVFDEEMTGDPEPDTAKGVAMGWDRVLGGRKTGVVFVEAERARESYESGPAPGHTGSYSTDRSRFGLESRRRRPGRFCFFPEHGTARRRRGRAVARQ